MSCIFNRLIALSIPCTTVFIFAMEPAKPKDFRPKILKVREITAVEEPQYASFLNHDLMIANAKCAYKVDWKNNAVTKKIFDKEFMISCFPDNTGKNVAISNLSGVKLYDQNGECTWSITSPNNNTMNPSPVFTRSNILYIINATNKKLLSNTGLNCELPKELHDNFYFFKITAHDEKIFCTTSIERATRQILHQITIHKGASISIDSQELPQRPDSDPEDFAAAFAQEHSPMRKIIALYYLGGIHRTPDKWELYNLETKQFITKNPLPWDLLTFHPHNPSWVAGFTHEGYLILYDMDKEKMITTTEKPLGRYIQGSCEPLLTRKIDFSPDGKHIALIVNKKCFMVDLDQDDAK